MGIVFGVVYVIGFVLTFVFFALFGKRIGVDYDKRDEFQDYNDWSDNESAYIAFSLCWPMIWLVAILGFIWGSLVRVMRIFLKILAK